MTTLIDQDSAQMAMREMFERRAPGATAALRPRPSDHKRNLPYGTPLASITSVFLELCAKLSTAPGSQSWLREQAEAVCDLVTTVGGMEGLPVIVRRCSLSTAGSHDRSRTLKSLSSGRFDNDDHMHDAPILDLATTLAVGLKVIELFGKNLISFDAALGLEKMAETSKVRFTKEIWTTAVLISCSTVLAHNAESVLAVLSPYWKGSLALRWLKGSNQQSQPKDSLKALCIEWIESLRGRVRDSQKDLLPTTSELGPVGDASGLAAGCLFLQSALDNPQWMSLSETESRRTVAQAGAVIYQAVLGEANSTLIQETWRKNPLAVFWRTVSSLAQLLLPAWDHDPEEARETFSNVLRVRNSFGRIQFDVLGQSRLELHIYSADAAKHSVSDKYRSIAEMGLQVMTGFSEVKVIYDHDVDALVREMIVVIEKVLKDANLALAVEVGKKQDSMSFFNKELSSRIDSEFKGLEVSKAVAFSEAAVGHMKSGTPRPMPAVPDFANVNSENKARENRMADILNWLEEVFEAAHGGPQSFVAAP